MRHHTVYASTDIKIPMRTQSAASNLINLNDTSISFQAHLRVHTPVLHHSIDAKNVAKRGSAKKRPCHKNRSENCKPAPMLTVLFSYFFGTASDQAVRCEGPAKCGRREVDEMHRDNVGIREDLDVPACKGGGSAQSH